MQSDDFVACPVCERHYTKTEATFCEECKVIWRPVDGWKPMYPAPRPWMFGEGAY